MQKQMMKIEKKKIYKGAPTKMKKINLKEWCLKRCVFA